MAKAPSKKAEPAKVETPVPAKKSIAKAAVVKAPPAEEIKNEPAVTTPEIAPEIAPEPSDAEPSLYDHLLDAARAVDAKFASPHPKESEQAFYKRLVGVINEVPDAVWAALPEPGQEWFNDAGKSIETNKPISSLSGYDSRSSKTAAIAAPAAGEEPKAKAAKGEGLKRYREEQAALKASGATIAPKKAKEKKAKIEKTGPGRVESIRNYVVMNPDAKNEEIAAHLEKIGAGPTQKSTIAISAQWTRDCIKHIKAVGHWKD